MATPLQHEQGRDEETAENEERVDPEESTGEPGLIEVEDDDRSNGESPEPVERGLVCQLVGGVGGGRRHGGIVPVRPADRTPGSVPLDVGAVSRATFPVVTIAGGRGDVVGA